MAGVPAGFTAGNSASRLKTSPHTAPLRVSRGCLLKALERGSGAPPLASSSCRGCQRLSPPPSTVGIAGDHRSCLRDPAPLATVQHQARQTSTRSHPTLEANGNAPWRVAFLNPTSGSETLESPDPVALEPCLRGRHIPRVRCSRERPALNSRPNHDFPYLLSPGHWIIAMENCS